MSYEDLVRNYTEIDKKDINGMRWLLLEDNEEGDEAPSIATNGDKYVYTWEDLEYTVEHLDTEYEVHTLEY